MKFTFNYLQDQPLLDAVDHPSLGGNINGPSLIKVPQWVNYPQGRYYLYFAHHEGKQINLAVADDLAGPWRIYPPGTLSLADSLFCQYPPEPANTHPDVLSAIRNGTDGDYPHIASPDVHIDTANKKILMYYHGRNPDGTQQTRVAESVDGLRFTPLAPLLGDSYFRVFQHRQHHYAIAWGSRLYRSTDGGRSFEAGPRLTSDSYRHGAILEIDNEHIHVVWSRAGDSPESLLISPLLMKKSGGDQQVGDSDWRCWQLGDSRQLHSPKRSWEGVNEPDMPSSYGGIMTSVNQLRDPCVYVEDGRIYLLYSIRGEQGIAMGTLTIE